MGAGTIAPTRDPQPRHERKRRVIVDIQRGELVIIALDLGNRSSIYD